MCDCVHLTIINKAGIKKGLIKKGPLVPQKSKQCNNGSRHKNSKMPSCLYPSFSLFFFLLTFLRDAWLFPYFSVLLSPFKLIPIMDAIRKKMQSLKSETDQLLATIAKFEGETTEANLKCEKYDCDIRDLGKKINGYEVDFDETNDKLVKALAALEEKEKSLKNAEEEVSALSRRIMLMEEEDKKAADTLCNTVTKLAITSKNADQILKAVKVVENTCLNNEVTIEELDKNLRSTIKMAVDN